MKHKLDVPKQTSYLRASVIQARKMKVKVHKTKATHFFQTVRSVINRIRRAICYTHNFSKILSGKLKCVCSPFSLFPACRQICGRNLTHSAIKQKKSEKHFFKKLLKRWFSEQLHFDNHKIIRWELLLECTRKQLTTTNTFFYIFLKKFFPIIHIMYTDLGECDHVAYIITKINKIYE